MRIAVGLRLGVPVCEDCGGLVAGSSCVVPTSAALDTA